MNRLMQLDLWSSFFIQQLLELCPTLIYSKSCIQSLGKNENITWNTILKYMDHIKWDFTYVSMNPNITWEIVKNNMNYKWSFKCLSQNPNITWEIIQNNPEYNWNMAYFSKNENIRLDIIENNDSNWNWFELSRNKSITFDIITKYDEYPWDMLAVCRNPNVTFELMQELSLDKVSMISLSSNPGILANDIEFSLDMYPWCISEVRKNPNIFLGNLIDLSQKLFTFIFENEYNFVDVRFFLIENQNTDFSLIKKYCDSSFIRNNMYSLCNNHFTLQRTMFLQDLQKHYDNSEFFQEVCEKVFHPSRILQYGVEYLDIL